MTCIDVYKNLSLQIVDDSVSISPCCLYPAEKTNEINFHSNSILVEARQQWDSGKIPQGCRACALAEQNGKASRRQGSNQWYADNGYDNTKIELLRLDYWTGDTCNLQCTICSPIYSSAWKEELNLPLPKRRQTVNYNWRDLDLSKLKLIHFNGGEPLLSKEHIQFLIAIPDKSQVVINYNTNGTIKPTQQLLDLWGKFKLVQLDFSIDDIGSRFEYQRYPAKWNNVIENLQWYIKNSPVNCMFAVNTTVSILNQHNLKNLNAWLSENFATNRVTDPIEHRQQAVVGVLEKLTPQAIAHLDACDQRRGTNWRTTFPELAEFYSEYLR